MERHPIDIWCFENGKTKRWFADRLGCTRPHLSNVTKGNTSFGLKYALGAVEIMGGQFTARDLLNWPRATAEQPTQNEA